eukprot:m.186171 g.186171  ORF g.186171 m.186171 type:complete len:52 (-) comp14750_c0_seq4:1806-1961(-)
MCICGTPHSLLFAFFDSSFVSSSCDGLRAVGDRFALLRSASFLSALSSKDS